MVKYKNGNVYVSIDENTGTKIRFSKEDDFHPSFAESMDVSITQKCSQSCNFCLAGSSLISIPNGHKKISEVDIDDVVISYNTKTSKDELKRVVAISKRYYTGKLIRLQFENGNLILCTPNHKIYTTNRGYVRADELTFDDDFICCKL